MPKRPLAHPIAIPERPVFTDFANEDFWHVPGYKRNLPHWRLKGATYFITFRLADSIPADVITRWEEDVRLWFRRQGMDLDWKQQDPDRFLKALSQVPSSVRQIFEREQARKFFLTLDDCHGGCVLKKPQAAAMVSEALRFFHGRRLWLGDFVVMPNHVHVIAQMFDGVSLEDWLYSVKRFTARLFLKDESLKAHAVKRSGHVWQTESFDRVVRDREELLRTRRYIEKNPAKVEAGEYLYHRAAWLDVV